MELKILQKKEEPLLSRMRIESQIIFEKVTPSNAEVKSDLAKILGKDEKLVEIKGIYNEYGQKKARVVGYAYENEDVLKKLAVDKKAKKEKKEPEKPEEKQGSK